MGFDIWLFKLINSFAGQNKLLDWAGIFCAEYLMYLMILAVLLYAIWDYKKYKDMAILAIGSALVARFVVAQAIKMAFYSPRPYWVLSQTHLLLASETQSSFPSGHTIFVFALATAVYKYNKKAGWWFFAGATLVGLSRIFVGVHWPYDIVSGAVLGILTGLVCDWGFRKYKHIFRL